MRRLQETTRRLVESTQDIKDIARRLVATCFYFDVVGEVKDIAHLELFEVSGKSRQAISREGKSLTSLEGYFHCRFLAGSEVAELGKFIRQHSNSGQDARFRIREEGNDADLPQEVRIDATVLNRMIEEKIFRMDKQVVIRRSNKLSRTEISLVLKREAIFPISGSPRRLHAERAINIGLFATLLL